MDSYFKIELSYSIFKIQNNWIKKIKLNNKKTEMEQKQKLNKNRN
jgi:hypothetical protein